MYSFYFKICDKSIAKNNLYIHIHKINIFERIKCTHKFHEKSKKHAFEFRKKIKAQTFVILTHNVQNAPVPKHL